MVALVITINNQKPQHITLSAAEVTELHAHVETLKPLFDALGLRLEIVELSRT